MSHSIANLEQNHFKYTPFRRPGDVHVHVFGTATLSFSDGIAAAPFSLPLCNPLAVAPAADIAVRVL